MNKKIITLLCLVSTSAVALEPISDEKLANTTGKDGITISYQNNGTLGIDKVRVIDTDGIRKADGTAETVKIGNANVAFDQAGGIELDMTGKVRFCTDNTASSTCNLATGPATITIDTDGGDANGAFVNININTASNSIYVPKTDLNLIGYGAVASGNIGGTPKPKQNPKIIVPTMTLNDGIKINSNNSIKANIQLGSEQQGHMMLISSDPTDKTTIDLGNITIHSHDDNFSAATNAATYKPTPTSQITTNVVIEEMTSAGTAIDIDATAGIVLEKPSTGIKAIKINNTVLGTANASDANIFNGLQNAAIGNISMEGIKITDLKIGIKGM